MFHLDLESSQESGIKEEFQILCPTCHKKYEEKQNIR